MPIPCQNRFGTNEVAARLAFLCRQFFALEGESAPVEEFAARLEGRFRKLLAAYQECVGERTPYKIALCARGGGDVLRLSEEGLAFVKYLADLGHVKILNSTPYVVKPST